MLADLNRAHRHLIVRVHDGDLILPLGLEHRALRDEQHVMLDAGGEVDLRIQTWAQSIVGIRKGRLNFDCAGLDFDLSIHVVDRARVFVGASISKDH